MPQSKCYKGTPRKVKIGDIVHVKDLNPVRGDWRIGEIVQIKDNADEIPRNVLIRYKTSRNSYSTDYVPSQSRTQWRNVKNLCMVLLVEELSEKRDEIHDSVSPKSNDN
jgi:hypothetical protein